MPRTTPSVFCVSTSPSTLMRQLGEWTVGGEHVGQVAEGVLVGIEPASPETSMRQPITYWPSWLRGVSRSTWIDAGGGRIVAMDDAVGDTKAHGQESVISSQSQNRRHMQDRPRGQRSVPGL